MPLDCTGCCAACSPRWKRLVDNIYPANAQEGLVRNNMHKLTFYALSSPEKLDRIGEYLSKRLGRDLTRNRIQFVAIAMEAMDQLLVACHAQSLNLFVESFLKMVQKLLECSDPDMQCLATTSFVKFSNIEEDTPSYHRRYDFFVSKFSAMCHSNHLTAKTRIRAAGLQGIQGVIRKTVCDELQPDIWEQHHMDKIVPSLLYNMHCREDTPGGNPEQAGGEETAHHLAEKVLRDLICRAAYNNLKAVLRPVLSHLDSHNLWTTTSFPQMCFKVIMYSVQAQYGHVVVQMLMSHLDSHSKSPAELKACITDVLSETVVIAAGGSSGPSVLDVFNSLLRHLKVSVECNPTTNTEQASNHRFQESIINTIGKFANHLPDFQKIEILMFVSGKMPLPQSESTETPTNTLLQTILLKTILKVATTYRTVLMANAFPASLKNPLLRMSLASKPPMRVITQCILHTLIDRHDNSEKLSKVWIPEDVAQLDLTVEKPSRQDVYFLKHGGAHILWHVLESFRITSNTAENIQALYKTMCLMLIELISEETVVEFISFMLQIQDTALQSKDVSTDNKRCIHASTLSFANLLCDLAGLTALQSHVNEVFKARKEQAPELLPEQAFTASEIVGIKEDIPSNCLLDSAYISKLLEEAGHDVTALNAPLCIPGSQSKTHSVSTVYRSTQSLDSHDQVSSKESDGGSVLNFDMDSVESSPAFQRRSIISNYGDEITFNKLKTVLDSEVDKAAIDARRKQLFEEFKSAPLEKIMNRSNSRNEMNDRLFEIIGSVEGEETENPAANGVTIDSIKYPAMFVY